MRNRLPFLPLIFSVCSLAAFQGNEFWHKREYRQWSERECKKMLEDSPWARGYTLSQTHITPLQQNEAADRERVENPRLNYQVQFRSALPLRQAMVRMQQISQKYDKMTEEQKQAFDKEAEKFLATSFPETVVLNVSFMTNVQQDDRDLARHWQTQTTETLKNFVYLINGKAIASAEDKTIKLEFQHPRLRTQGETRVLIEFRVDRMMWQGAPLF